MLAKRSTREISRNVLMILAIAYFAPPWLLPLLMLFFIYSVFFSQRAYRRALTLVDQFYDRTVYRFDGNFTSLVRPT
jgi:hypothetical protein